MNSELTIQLKLFIIIVLCICILTLLVFKKDKSCPDIEPIAQINTQLAEAIKPPQQKVQQEISLIFDKEKYNVFRLSLDYDTNIPVEKKRDKLPQSLRKNIEKIVDSGDLIQQPLSILEKNKKIIEFNNLVKTCMHIMNSVYISNPHLISLKIN